MNEEQAMKKSTPLGELDWFILGSLGVLAIGMVILIRVVMNPPEPQLVPEGATSAIAVPKTNSETYLEPVAGTAIKVIPAVPSTKEDMRRIDFVVEVSPSEMAAINP